MSIGSRNAHTPTLLRLVIGAAILLAFAAAMTVVAQQATAGVEAKVTVNSTGNTDTGSDDTGDCDTTPASGTCNLRQAINAVNAGEADEINFHPAVFPKANPGVINIEGGDGCLPDIKNEVTIDSTNSGVILDGDGNNDFDAIDCGEVIHVHATHNGFDFALLGGKNFTIREFDGYTNAIDLDGDDDVACDDNCSFNNVTITGVIIQDGDTGETDNEYNIGDGIEIEDARDIANAKIGNNVIVVDSDGIDIDVDGDEGEGNDLTNSVIDINNNTITADVEDAGGGEGVDVDIDGDLTGKITVNVHDNPNITALESEAVEIDFGRENFFDAGGAAVNVMVNDNAKLHGGETSKGSEHTLEIEIIADDSGANDGAADIDVQVNGNGLIDASDDSDGVHLDIEVCCDQSDSTVDVTVNGNDDIIGDDDGVRMGIDVGCGDDNVLNVSVNDNGSIEGQNGEGVDLEELNVGDYVEDCKFFGRGGEEVGAAGGNGQPCPDQQSDGNSALVQVNGNEQIDGGDADGIEIDLDVGSSCGAADDNTATVEVTGNGEIQGEDEGVHVDDADAGSDIGEDADNNTTTVTIADNENITGGLGGSGDGVEVDASSGIDAGPDDLPGGGDQDGDENMTIVNVTGNGNIRGGDEDGVDIEVESGGSTASSDGNHNVVNVTGNGELVGRESSSGAGLEVDFEVCCDSANTNTLSVANNGDIIGRDSDGINLDFCCSVNIVSIVDNGTIRGNGDNGIDYDVDIWSDLDGDFTEPCPEECGIFTSVNSVTISGNDIFNSESNGIEICCGLFQLPATQAPAGVALKSVITNNQIHHNRDHGINLHSTVGFNITQNEIFSNGDNPLEDAGIEIDTDDSGGGIQGNFGPGDIIREADANKNLISENSIYDNIGLGIDLEGDPDKDDEGEHGVGCNAFPSIPSPNDCIQAPIIQTLSGAKLVGAACSLCTVEIFEADATPADQPLLGSQNGEGRTFLVSGEADADGDWSINIPCDLGDLTVTATATDKIKNSSEFSQNFTVLGIPCTPTPTNTVPPTATNTPVPATATPTATTGPAKVCGDADADGSVTSLDSLQILQFKAALIGAVGNALSADVDGNGEIQSIDAALILQHVAALLDELTGCLL